MAEIDLKQELTLLLEKEIGFTGKFILEKQCRSLEIDPDHICSSDLERLASKVTWAIRGYTGERRAEEIKKDILEYRTALEIVDSAVANEESPTELIEAKLTIANKKLAVGMAAEAKDALENARAIMKEMEPKDARPFEARISRLMGRLLSRSKDTLDEARAEFQQAIAAGKRSRMHYDVALSWNGLGNISWRVGDHKDALENYKKALKALSSFEAHSRNDKQKKHGAEAITKSGLGNVYLDLLDYDAAIRYNEEAIELFRKMGNDAEVGRVYNNLARVYEEMGNFPRAIDRYERAIRYTEGSGSARMEAWALTNLASVLVENRELDDAKPHLVKAEKILRDFSDPIAHSKLNCMWGKYHREKREWSSGIDRFLRSIELVASERAPDYLAIAMEEFGYLYFYKGDNEKAKEFLGQALAWYEEKKEATHIAKIEEKLAKLDS